MTSQSTTTIPHLAEGQYIGGLAALNLPSSHGGDWHADTVFTRERKPRSFVSGAGTDTDTGSILGDEGIIDCTGLVLAMGISHAGKSLRAASHQRAIADLVVSALARGRRLDHLIPSDWLPDAGAIAELTRLLDIAIRRLDAGQAGVLVAWRTRHAI
jgi:hypothetical protein